MKSFKVWLHVEEFDEATGEGCGDIDLPFSSVTSFGTREEAIKFAGVLQRVGQAMTDPVVEVPHCPDCNDALVDLAGAGPTYCATCDREIADNDLVWGVR